MRSAWVELNETLGHIAGSCDHAFAMSLRREQHTSDGRRGYAEFLLVRISLLSLFPMAIAHPNARFQ